MDFNPDKGSGKPGSLRWHTLHVMQCGSLRELEEYLRSVVGHSFSLEQFKDCAVELIKEHTNGEG